MTEVTMQQECGQVNSALIHRNRVKSGTLSYFQMLLIESESRLKNEREVIPNYFPSQSFFRCYLITSSS
jgi:hypothetical protein